MVGAGRRYGRGPRRMLRRGPNVSVGMLTADLLRLGEELAVIGDAGVELVHVDVMGTPSPGVPVVDVLRDLPASERFFAGGDTTIRGFAPDQVGTRATIDADGVAIGGNALVIFNAELRVPVRGSLGAVGFLDSGNVFKKTTDISLADLRATAGFGLRYKSPVGPIRVDVGFKVPRREIAIGKRENLAEFHISLGQAF